MIVLTPDDMPRQGLFHVDNTMVRRSVSRNRDSFDRLDLNDIITPCGSLENTDSTVAQDPYNQRRMHGVGR